MVLRVTKLADIRMHNSIIENLARLGSGRRWSGLKRVRRDCQCVQNTFYSWRRSPDGSRDLTGMQVVIVLVVPLMLLRIKLALGLKVETWLGNIIWKVCSACTFEVDASVNLR